MKRFIKSLALTSFLSTIPFSAYAEKIWDWVEDNGDMHSVALKDKVNSDGTRLIMWTTYPYEHQPIITSIRADCEKKTLRKQVSYSLNTHKTYFHPKKYDRMPDTVYKIVCLGE